jgi:hypothetical protein
MAMSNAQRPLPSATRASSIPPPSGTRPVAPRPPPLVRVPEPSSPTLPGLPIAELREENRIFVKAAVDDAIAPLALELRMLRTRIEDLERKRPTERPAPLPAPVVAAVAPPPVAPLSIAPPAPAPPTPPAQSFAFGAPPSSIVPSELLVPETNLSIDYELRAVDGGRRRRRTAAAVGFAILVVIGGMLGAMALSYA